MGYTDRDRMIMRLDAIVLEIDVLDELRHMVRMLGRNLSYGGGSHDDVDEIAGIIQERWVKLERERMDIEARLRAF